MGKNSRRLAKHEHKSSIHRPYATHLSLRDQQIQVKYLVMSSMRRVKSKSWLGKNSRGLAKHNHKSSNHRPHATHLSLRDQQIQVKDLVDVNGWSLSEAGSKTICQEVVQTRGETP